MIPQNVDIQAMSVEDWFANSSKDLSPEQKILLLEKAIRAVENRASKTLSTVTLIAVLDRVLHETQQRFSILSEANFDIHALKFTGAEGKQETEKKIEALKAYLIDFLKVLSRLTANILNKPLQDVLLKVTSKDSEES